MFWTWSLYFSKSVDQTLTRQTVESVLCMIQVLSIILLRGNIVNPLLEAIIEKVRWPHCAPSELHLRDRVCKNEARVSCSVEAKVSEHIAQECGPGASPYLGPSSHVSFLMSEILQQFYFQKMSIDLQEQTSIMQRVSQLVPNLKKCHHVIHDHCSSCVSSHFSHYIHNKRYRTSCSSQSLYGVTLLPCVNPSPSILNLAQQFC